MGTHRCNENNCFRSGITRVTEKFEKKMKHFRMLKNQLRAGVMTMSLSSASERACLVHAFQSMCLAKMAVDNYDPQSHRLEGKTLDGRKVRFSELKKMYSGNGQKIPILEWCGCDTNSPFFWRRV